MGQIIRTPIVIDSFTGATDIVISGNYIMIPGLDSNGASIATSLYWPGGSAGGGVKAQLTETPQVQIFTPTATASTLCAIVITQFNRQTKLWQSYPVQHVNQASGGSATITCNNLRSQINAMNTVNGGGSLNVIASGSSTLILTGGTGDPLFYVQALSDGSFGATPMLQTVTIASNTTATPTVFTTSAPHGLSIGMKVTITTADATKFVAGTYVIGTASFGASAFTLYQLDGVTPLAGTSTTTGTITLVAQNSAYTYAQVNANIPLNGTPVAGATYSTLVWNGVFPDAPLLTEGQNTLCQQTIYFKYGGTNVLANLVLLEAAFVTAGVLA